MMTEVERNEGMARLDAQFMSPRIWRGDAWEVSANHGETHIVDAGVAGTDPTCLADYIEGTIDTDDDDHPIAVIKRGVWLAQLSASGYMDQTDLTIHESREAAEEYLVETYDDGPTDAQ